MDDISIDFEKLTLSCTFVLVCCEGAIVPCSKFAIPLVSSTFEADEPSLLLSSLLPIVELIFNLKIIHIENKIIGA